MNYPYKSIYQLVELIDEPNRSACVRFLTINQELLQTARGSSNNHQAWEGGYIDHIEDVMNIALVLYPTLTALRPVSFSLSDALLVLFLHDLEKPWKYEQNSDGSWQTKPKLVDKEIAVKDFVANKASVYGFELTAQHQNGIDFAEGEKGNYSSKNRMASPLAAFAHLCDHWSARGWFDYPKKDGDEWKKT